MSSEDQRIILSNDSINVIFNDIFNDSNNNPYFNVLINVKLFKYVNGNQYYYLKYNYEFNQGNLTDIEQIEKFKKNILNFGLSKESMKGEIVYKNDITTVMTKYLLMDDITLEKYSGSTTAQQYRRMIMVALSQFWD